MTEMGILSGTGTRVHYELVGGHQYNIVVDGRQRLECVTSTFGGTATLTKPFKGRRITGHPGILGGAESAVRDVCRQVKELCDGKNPKQQPNSKDRAKAHAQQSGSWWELKLWG